MLTHKIAFFTILACQFPEVTQRDIFAHVELPGLGTKDHLKWLTRTDVRMSLVFEQDGSEERIGENGPPIHMTDDLVRSP